MSEATQMQPVPMALTDEANTAMTAKAREASALAKSSLVPEAYRGNPANVLIAMEMAQRIGASVMAVMQNLHVIHGKPSFSSSFLIATVNACGRFSPLRFRFEGDEGSEDYGCRAIAADLKTGEECIGPKITNRMVDAEGWRKKSGSKWLTMPELMFTYRAAAFWTRIFAPEVSLGMHTDDEVLDFAPPAVAPVATLVRPNRPRSLEALAPAATEGSTAGDTGGAQEPAGEASEPI